MSNNEAYLGDLNKTQIISDLIRTPFLQRDEKWQKDFLNNAAQASFRCGDPQVIQGPDGFPYFTLFLPEPGKPFQCFVIEKMKDDFLLEKGFGVVINPTEQGPDWVFNYGDILHYHLKSTLEYSYLKFNDQPVEVLKKEEEVLMGAPSEAILPSFTRKILKSFLEANGLAEPKVLLMQRKNEQCLAFNISPQNLGGEQQSQQLLQYLTWFLPRDYQVIGLDEDKFMEYFKAL